MPGFSIDQRGLSFHQLTTPMARYALPPVTTFQSFDGTPDDDHINGTDHHDTFNMADGGHDNVHGRGGDDTFNFGAEFDANVDRVFGGSDFDTLVLDGDYNIGFFQITAVMLQQVEQIDLIGNHSYSIIIGNGVQSGHTLVIDGSESFSSVIITDTNDGPLEVIGGSGNDFFQLGADFSNTIRAGAGIDTIHMGQGHLVLKAGDDADSIITHNSLTSDDRIRGGAGVDNMLFNGDTNIAMKNGTVKGVERFTFSDLNDFAIATANGTVGAGQLLLVDASGLASHSLTFNGAKESNGFFDITGGDKNDALKGGALDDTIHGGHGKDELTGRGGSDQLDGGSERDEFKYGDVSDSTGVLRDMITGFDAEEDRVNLPVNIQHIDDPIVVGALSEATFDSSMETVVNDTKLDAHHALLYTPSGGDLAGRFFLVMDANGDAGYQGGEDYVIELLEPDNLSFTNDTFI